MREIKFRAWDGEKMYLPEYADKEDFHILPDGTIVETHEHGYERHELTSRRGDNWKLMQYTGLTDVNGIDIYEGDVVRIADANKSEYSGGSPYVVFANGSFQYRYAKWDPAASVSLSPTADIMAVVGNIHENPDLLGSTVNVSADTFSRQG